MARKGNGSSDNLYAAFGTQLTNYSFHMLYQNDSASGTSVVAQPFALVNASGDGFAFSWDHTSGSFNGALAHKDSVGWKACKYGTLSADTPYRLGASFDGSNIRTYQDGAHQNTTAAGNAVGGGAVGLSLLAGAQGTASFDDGEVAEFGLWNAQLTAAEFAALAAGVSPKQIRPSALVRYVPCFGNDSPELELRAGDDLTVTGTTKVPHPRVIYPKRRIWLPTGVTAPPTEQPITAFLPTIQHCIRTPIQ